MSQFYITDSKSLRTVREAVHHRMPITISGMVGKGVRYFTGVVQSVESETMASNYSRRTKIGRAQN